MNFSYRHAILIVLLFSISSWFLYFSYTLRDSKNKALKEEVVPNNANGKYFYWILTTEKNHETRCKGIIESWGKWTKHLLFMSNVESDLPSIAINEKDEFLDRKELASWKLIYEKYYEEFDWFIKGDDDTFYIVPNLESLLSQLDPNEPYFLGRRFRLPSQNIVYPSGGAGYVISKKALQLFYKQIDTCMTKCIYPNHPGDVAIGVCLKEAGVIMSETRDELARERFHPLTPSHHLGYDFEAEYQRGEGWYRKWSWYGLNEFGPNCCPPSTISFHYIDPKTMNEMFYYLAFKKTPDVWESIFGSSSSLNIDVSGKSVNSKTTHFQPENCSSNCQQKYENENHRKACDTGCEIFFYGQGLGTPQIIDCSELKNENEKNLVDICLKQMWPFELES